MSWPILIILKKMLIALSYWLLFRRRSAVGVLIYFLIITSEATKIKKQERKQRNNTTKSKGWNYFNNDVSLGSELTGIFCRNILEFYDQHPFCGTKFVASFSKTNMTVFLFLSFASVDLGCNWTHTKANQHR